MFYIYLKLIIAALQCQYEQMLSGPDFARDGTQLLDHEQLNAIHFLLSSEP